MKTILITGAAGFLGSNLAKRLYKEGNKIICLDNFYTGNFDNLKELSNKPNFEFTEHDVINPYDFKVDEIYNLACPASPPHYQKDPIYTSKTSYFGILNALECAKKHNAKILQASTSEVYGDAKVHPQNEMYFGNVNPCGIRACYDEGKRAAEALMFDYNRMFRTKIKVVRIFNTYGENMDINDGRVVSNFITQALQNKDITIYGKGEQTRSFCYVEDLINGIISAMNTDDDFTGPVNIGNPCEISILEFANLVIKLTNSKSKIIFQPLPSDDPIMRRPDISLAKEKLNYEPKINLEEGLKKTIEYFEEKLK